MASVEQVSAARARVAAAQRRLEAELSVCDIDPQEPSRLPGWSLGHVMTHLARNADSVVRRLEAAARGESISQYAGGAEQRASDIEAGARRPLALLIADITASDGAVERAAELLGGEDWEVESLGVTGEAQSALTVLLRREREVVLHHSDLGLGFEPRDWPTELSLELITENLDTLPLRAGASELAGWLADRGPAPLLSPWT